MIREHEKFKSSPKKIEQKILEGMSPTKRLNNFLDSSEISELYKIFQKAKKSNSSDASQQLLDDLLNNEDILESKKLESRPTDTIQCAAALNWHQGVSEILQHKLEKEVEDFKVVGGTVSYTHLTLPTTPYV